MSRPLLDKIIESPHLSAGGLRAAAVRRAFTHRRGVGRVVLALAVAAAMTRPASAEWTLSVFLGGTRTRDTSLELVRPADGTHVTLSPVHYDSASFEAPFYYGYRVGFFPRSRWFGIEGEFIHLKVNADPARLTHAEGVARGELVTGLRPVASIIERFSITHGVNLVLVNAVARREIGSSARTAAPRWILLGRLGAGASIPRPESTIDGVSFEDYEWGASAVQGAGAIELRIGGPVYIAAEYKFTRTVQHVTIAGGSARTPLVTHHVVGGVIAHLGGPRWP
jgi:hypothetical protein